MTAQNCPLALEAALLLLLPASTQRHQLVLLLCRPGCRHRLTCLNEALSVTAFKSDTFINKVGFFLRRYYLKNKTKQKQSAEKPWIVFTFSLLNFPVLLTLAVIFLLSQDPEVPAHEF